MKKKIIWGLGFVVLLFLLIVVVQTYRDWRDSTAVDRLAKKLREQQQEILDKKTADKIGGKTPQETLDLFIGAVEAGDYELASKYFVTEGQEKALKELIALEKNNNIDMYLNILQKAVPDGEMGDDYFRMKSELEAGSPDYLLDFILYPSGNWKIEEI